jgi:DNA polymerase III subunit delta'
MTLIGHQANLAQFGRAHASGRLHHGWIFAGPRGVGKARFALEAARMLVDPEHRYSSMIEHCTHPDIIWLQRLPKEPPKDGEEADPDAELKRSISIDQVRAVQHALTTRPSMGEKRAVIIDAADDLERGGANALLKSLEEPPVGTHFLLISHMSDRLLPTIRSRCQLLRFNPLEESETAQVLRNLMPEANEASVEQLAKAGAGSPGNAMRFAGLNFDAIETAIEAIITSGDASNKLRHQLAETLSLKAAQERYEAFLRHVPARIAAFTREMAISDIASGVDAFHKADALAARAIGLSLDKSAVVFEMGSLLVSLGTHKQAAR